MSPLAGVSPLSPLGCDSDTTAAARLGRDPVAGGTNALKTRTTQREREGRRLQREGPPPKPNVSGQQAQQLQPSPMPPTWRRRRLGPGRARRRWRDAVRRTDMQKWRVPEPADGDPKRARVPALDLLNLYLTIICIFRIYLTLYWTYIYMI